MPDFSKVHPLTSISLDDIKTEEERYRILGIALAAHDYAIELAREAKKPFKFFVSDFSRNKVECHEAIAWYNVYVRISNVVNDFNTSLVKHPLCEK